MGGFKSAPNDEELKIIELNPFKAGAAYSNLHSR
jgi:hypothetical protein